MTQDSCLISRRNIWTRSLKSLYCCTSSHWWVFVLQHTTKHIWFVAHYLYYTYNYKGCFFKWDELWITYWVIARFDLRCLVDARLSVATIDARLSEASADAMRKTAITAPPPNVEQFRFSHRAVNTNYNVWFIPLSHRNNMCIIHIYIYLPSKCIWCNIQIQKDIKFSLPYLKYSNIRKYQL